MAAFEYSQWLPNQPLIYITLLKPLKPVTFREDQKTTWPYEILRGPIFKVTNRIVEL